MPDVVLMSKAMLVAAAVSAAAMLLASRTWRAAQRVRAHLGAAWGIGVGFFLGCGALRLWPRWPPAEDRDRFLLVLLPATLLVESLAAWPSAPRRLVWPLRIVLAATAVPTLLYGSSYLADAGRPGTRAWSIPQAALILALLAAMLATVWALLERLSRRGAARATAAALSMSSAAAGVTVMLSGYLSAGEMGLSLAASLAGVWLASFASSAESQARMPLGVGIVGLFGVLAVGRFFGALPGSSALALFCAPLCGWLTELPKLRTMGPRWRDLLRLLLVAIPLIAVVALAQHRFAAANRPGTEADWYQQ